MMLSCVLKRMRNRVIVSSHTCIQMFPRHVLEFMVGEAGVDSTMVPEAQAKAQAKLASYHKGITILFLDIVGE